MNKSFNHALGVSFAALVIASEAHLLAQEDEVAEARSHPFAEAATETTDRSVADTATIHIGHCAALLGEGRIRAALDEPTSCDFVDTPLDDVMAYLEDKHQIEIEFDRRALDDIGIDSMAPVNLSVHGITLRSALHLILDDYDLSFVIDYEVLLITTIEDAEYRMSLSIYPVHDLAPSDAEMDELMEAVLATVSPLSWDEAGGGCVMRSVGKALLVSANCEIHEELEQVLAGLRKVPR